MIKHSINNEIDSEVIVYKQKLSDKQINNPIVARYKSE